MYERLYQLQTFRHFRQDYQRSVLRFQQLGFGFLESIYEKLLEIRLRKAGLNVSRQQPITVFFEGEIVGDFYADLVIDNTVIIELKALENIHPKHGVQLVNYL